MCLLCCYGRHRIAVSDSSLRQVALRLCKKHALSPLVSETAWKVCSTVCSLACWTVDWSENPTILLGATGITEAFHVYTGGLQWGLQGRGYEGAVDPKALCSLERARLSKWHHTAAAWVFGMGSGTQCELSLRLMPSLGF